MSDLSTLPAAPSFDPFGGDAHAYELAYAEYQQALDDWRRQNPPPFGFSFSNNPAITPQMDQIAWDQGYANWNVAAASAEWQARGNANNDAFGNLIPFIIAGMATAGAAGLLPGAAGVTGAMAESFGGMAALDAAGTIAGETALTSAGGKMFDLSELGFVSEPADVLMADAAGGMSALDTAGAIPLPDIPVVSYMDALAPDMGVSASYMDTPMFDTGFSTLSSSPANWVPDAPARATAVQTAALPNPNDYIGGMRALDQASAGAPVSSFSSFAKTVPERLWKLGENVIMRELSSGRTIASNVPTGSRIITLPGGAHMVVDANGRVVPISGQTIGSTATGRVMTLANGKQVQLDAQGKPMLSFFDQYKLPLLAVAGFGVIVLMQNRGQKG